MDAEIDRLKEDFKKVYHSKIQTTKVVTVRFVDF